MQVRITETVDLDSEDLEILRTTVRSWLKEPIRLTGGWLRYTYNLIGNTFTFDIGQVSYVRLKKDGTPFNENTRKHTIYPSRSAETRIETQVINKHFPTYIVDVSVHQPETEAIDWSIQAPSVEVTHE